MKNAPTSLILTRNHLKFLLWGDIVAIVILFILSIAVMMSSSVENCFMVITGTENKLELLKFIGWVISGLIAIFGVIGLFQRAEALDKQNEVNEQGHIQRAATIEKGHVQERFKAATEHLGNERVSVRISAFYEFYHLAEIEPVWRKTIFDILCAHLRQTTTHENYQPKERGADKDGTKEMKSTEEVQSLLNILFKPDNKDNFIFVGMVANLEDANLQGANLQGANLQLANLQNTELQYANLRKANLFNADMREVKLHHADLQKADMKKVHMFNADMPEANLEHADLQEADLLMVGFYNANLQYANLQGADMEHTYLQNANLQMANLQGVNLLNAIINEETKMPNNWKNIVKRNENGETGVTEE